MKALELQQLDKFRLPPNMATNLRPRIYSSLCPLISILST